MKQLSTIITACLVATAAWGQQTWSTNVPVNTAVPDNDASGLAGAFTVSGLSGAITDVTVTLDLTGGYDGDLYAYIVGPNGGFAVLLNRAGLSATNANGYGDTGFNITIDDSATYANLHNYQSSGSYATNGSGQVTGTWASDGRNIDPQSAAGAFDSAAVTATLGSFVGNDANGTWGFYIADLSPGGQSTLVSYGVTIQTVPEPQTWSLMALVAGCGILTRFRQRSNSNQLG